MTYTASTDGDFYHTLKAKRADLAWSEAVDWTASGDCDTSGGTIWVRVALSRNNKEIRSGYVAIDPPEPKCHPDETHDWVSPHWLVGGDVDNPGVWGHGGGVICTAACRHCGCKRVSDSWAQNPETGEQGLNSVRYEPGFYEDDFGDRGTKDADIGSPESAEEAAEAVAGRGRLYREAYCERMAHRMVIEQHEGPTIGRTLSWKSS